MTRTSSVPGLLAILLLAGCCNPPDTASLSVTLNGQLTNMWCWAASGQMTMDFVHPGVNVQQCDEANKEFGRSDCCNSPVPNKCIEGGWPEYTKYGFKADQTSDAPLTWSQIKRQIFCAEKPFAFSWHWNNGGGHMMVVTGYTTVDGTHYVDVNNPWPPTSGVQVIYTYDNYVGGAGYDHSHWNDFYNITYTGGP